MTIAEKLQKIAENERRVYEAGKKAQYDEFWDSQLPAIDWTARFAGRCWNETTFKPTYDLILQRNCNHCFLSNGSKVDMVEHLEALGITLNTTQMTSCTNLFAYSLFTRLGVIDLSNLSAATSAFTSMPNLVTIDKVIVSEKLAYSNTFQNLSNLVNLIIEGTIGKDGLNFQWSTKLSKASITSIINALSSTTSGLTVTLSATAVDSAFEGGSTGSEWTTLIATKNNWTISLV